MDLFAHLDSAQLPTPILFSTVNGRVPGTFLATTGKLETCAEVFPHVVFSGWKINDQTGKTFAKTLELLLPALRRMQLILSNGYESNSHPGANSNWDVMTLSATIMLADNPPGSFNGAGFWVPGIWAAIRSARTRWDDAQSYDDSLTSEQCRIASESVVFRGIGATVASQINTLAFGRLFFSREFALSERLLELSWRMDCPQQSSNSLSNWGIALYIQNDFKGAREKFVGALNREDHFADAEAYAYLAEIADAEGDETLYAEFRQKCNEAGGYLSPIFNRLEAVETDVHGLETENKPTLTKTSGDSIGTPSPSNDSSGPSSSSKFCTQCGTAFGNNEAKFCTQCGSSRA
jgi:hypothetical protein